MRHQQTNAAHNEVRRFKLMFAVTSSLSDYAQRARVSCLVPGCTQDFDDMWRVLTHIEAKHMKDIFKWFVFEAYTLLSGAAGSPFFFLIG